MKENEILEQEEKEEEIEELNYNDDKEIRMFINYLKTEAIHYFTRSMQSIDAINQVKDLGLEMNSCDIGDKVKNIVAINMSNRISFEKHCKVIIENTEELIQKLWDILDKHRDPSE